MSEGRASQRDALIEYQISQYKQAQRAEAEAWQEVQVLWGEEVREAKEKERIIANAALEHQRQEYQLQKQERRAALQAEAEAEHQRDVDEIVYQRDVNLSAVALRGQAAWEKMRAGVTADILATVSDFEQKRAARTLLAATGAHSAEARRTKNVEAAVAQFKEANAQTLKEEEAERATAREAIWCAHEPLRIGCRWQLQNVRRRGGNGTLSIRSEYKLRRVNGSLRVRRNENSISCGSTRRLSCVNSYVKSPRECLRHIRNRGARQLLQRHQV